VEARAAGVLAGGVAWLGWANGGGLAFGRARLSLLLRLVLATGAGGLLYVGVSRLLRVPELATISGVVTDLVRRRA
jgi:zinc transporter ZupT